MSGEDANPDSVKQGLSMIFGTPFVSYQWPESDDLNAELEEFILRAEAADEHGRGIRSNAGGWQSRGNIMSAPDNCIQRLKKRVEELVLNVTGEIILKEGSERSFTLISDGWANVCRPGNYNVVHTHPNAMWSLVYYVSSGKPDPSIPYSGMLELLDPRESANYIQIQNTVLDARTFIENIPGRMIMFPSWVKHMVHPFIGEGVRISVATNVNVIENHPNKP